VSKKEQRPLSVNHLYLTVKMRNEICPQCKKKSLRYWSEDWEEDRSRIVDPMYDMVEYNRKEHIICDECGYKDTQHFTHYYDCRYKKKE